MKIFCFSDGHGYLPPIPDEVDLVLCAGDIAPDYLYEIPRNQMYWFNDSFRIWSEDHNKPTVIISGNHELVFESKYKNLIEFANNVKYLQDESFSFRGINIYGTPWQTPFGIGYAFNAPETELKNKYSAIPDDTHIIVSHCPPYGINDWAPRRIKNSDKYRLIRQGSISLTERMETLPNLKFLVCGHLHNIKNKTPRKYKETTVLNCSIRNEGYEGLKVIKYGDIIEV
jgi:Icc-related predicted phosphoesterase